MYIVNETPDKQNLKNNSEVFIINSPIGKILVEQNVSECFSQPSSCKTSQTKVKRTLFSCESSKRLKSGKIQLFLNMYLIYLVLFIDLFFTICILVK